MRIVTHQAQKVQLFCVTEKSSCGFLHYFLLPQEDASAPNTPPFSVAPVRVNVPATLSCHGSDGGEWHMAVTHHEGLSSFKRVYCLHSELQRCHDDMRWPLCLLQQTEEDVNNLSTPSLNT